MLSLQIKQPRRDFTVNVQLTVPPGKIYCLFGASGSGKSTILAVTAGFESLHQGRIQLHQKALAVRENTTNFQLPSWKRQLGYISQKTHLFPHLNVLENIAFALPFKRTDAYTEQLVQTLELQNDLKARIQTLSGGQQQRVALARALAVHPQVLLLDEPFSALDQPARLELQLFLQRLNEEFQISILLVTHQLTEAQHLGHIMGILEEGQLWHEASPAQLLATPQTVKMAKLLGYQSFLPAKVWGLGQGCLALHPDRVLLGNFPAQGPVVQAVVDHWYLYEGRWRMILNGPHGYRVQATNTLGLPLTKGELVFLTLLHPLILPEEAPDEERKTRDTL